MKKYLIICILFSLLACDESEQRRTTYSLGSNVITRFDIDRSSYFFHGDKQSADTLDGYILARYTRGTDIMDAYLVFNSDSTVDLVTVAGDFEKRGHNNSIKLVNFEVNTQFIEWKQKMRQNPLNAIRIDDVLEVEKRYNDTVRTNIKSIYY